eukprot:scaffold58437_cov54-Attheya_sp.AAC.1
MNNLRKRRSRTQGQRADTAADTSKYNMLTLLFRRSPIAVLFLYVTYLSSLGSSRRFVCDAFAFQLPSSSRTGVSAQRATAVFDETGGKRNDDEAVSTPTEFPSRASPVVRGVEVASIAVWDMAMPLVASVLSSLSTSRPSDYNESIWTRSGPWCKDGRTLAQQLVFALEQLGPTYVKFGQALASRPDIIPEDLAEALSALQDDMIPFDTVTAKKLLLEELLASANTSTGIDNPKTERVLGLVESLSDEPVAAASIGQVYKGILEGYGPVAVKVQRPGIRELVERDAALLRSVAIWIESLPAISSSSAPHSMKNTDKKQRLVATELVTAVDEFMSRIFEELDYLNEAKNAAKFAGLYSHRNGTARDTLPSGVVVPEILEELCTKNVLVMEWIEGTKLTNVTTSEGGEPDPILLQENLALIELGIECTLSQLLDTGVMHADPHGGNLLKVKCDEDGLQSGHNLAYLDFGLLATVPTPVRDALVCAVAQLVFARDVNAVADLFGELDLLPPDVFEDPIERVALGEALTLTLNEALIYPTKTKDVGMNNDTISTTVPVLRFDKVLNGLTQLVPRFRFQLPPYFLNNARALGTLEGIARQLNPDFNVLQILYPYAIHRIIQNPTKSPVVDETLQSLMRRDGRLELGKISQLLEDSAALTGYRKRRVLWDILKTKEGRTLARSITKEGLATGIFTRKSIASNQGKRKTKRRSFLSRDYLKL